PRAADIPTLVRCRRPGRLQLTGAPTQFLDKRVDRAATALDDRAELITLGDAHADALHRDIDDLVVAVTVTYAPIDADRRPARPQDLAADDRIAAAFLARAGDFQRLAGVHRETPRIDLHDHVGKQSLVIPLLLGCGQIPIASQHEAGDI